MVPQALEDITNKKNGSKNLSFEDVKRQVKNTIPSSSSSSIPKPCENVELLYSPTAKGKRREDKRNRIQSSKKYDDMNSNIDEMLREVFPEDNPETPTRTQHDSPSSSSQPVSELLARLILLDKNEILQRVSGFRVIEYMPKNERIRYKKLAAAEYVKKVKEIVDDDIVNSERYINIMAEAEKLGYDEMAELLRKIKEEEESSCLVDPLHFMKRFFCGLYS